MSRILKICSTFVVVWLSAPHVHPGETGPLARVSDIRALSRADAAKAMPVRLDGVVIWQKPGGFVIWDGERSVWADFSIGEPGTFRMENCRVDDILPGAHLQIEGVTMAGRYSPVVALGSVRFLGRKPLPKPAVVPLAGLLSGGEAGQFIELEGVVQRAEKDFHGGITAQMMVDGHLCAVNALQCGGVEPASVVDARIRVRGIFIPDTNFRSEAVGLGMMVARADDDIDIITPAPPDPFSSPRVTLGNLLPFSPDVPPFHRKVVSGLVTFAAPGWFFFLTDGKTSVRVNSPSRDVHVGRNVDVAGFVNTSHTIASLGNAELRDLGPGILPATLAVTVSGLLDPDAGSGLRKATSNDLSGQLVTLKGTLLRIEWKREGVPAAVRIGSDGRTFPAFFPVDHPLTGSEADAWATGAEVELTGIVEYDFGKERNPSGEYPLVAFHMWLAGPYAIKVLNPPSWWTPARLGMALAGCGVVLVLVLSWSWALRLRVRAQTAMISGQIQRAAVQDERARIARDMHDEVGARLSRLAMLHDIFARDHSQGGLAGDELMRLAKDTREAVTALDEVVWTVNPQNDTLASMAEYIAHHAGGYLEPAGIACRLRMPIGWPDLVVRSHTRHELVHAFKEALQNVVKHARATEVLLEMRIENGIFHLTVADNGCGLPADAAGRRGDGLDNMKSRLGRIGGTCEIISRNSSGATVFISLPLCTVNPPLPHA